MKRMIMFLIVLAFVLLSTACSAPTENSYESIEPTYFSDGSRCYFSGNHLTYSLATLPFDMMIENKAVPFIKTSFFELHENHGYTAYFVATLDRSNLSDDDVYWITKYDSNKFNKTIDLNVYVDSEKNELDTERLNYLGCVYDSNNIYFSFSSDLQRYSFLDSEFSCQFIYIPTGLIEDDTVYYYYDHIITSDNYSDSVGSLSSGERDALIQSLTK